jgi:glutamate---cysteine ligase / carboxylate-amine ligase
MRTIGVEEELLIVDPQSGHPRALAAVVIAAAKELGAGAVERELQQQQVEIATAPCHRLAELAEELTARRAEVARAARAQDAAVVALASSPVWVDATVSDDLRYRQLVARFGLPAREQLTCGCHVHVGVASAEEAVAVLDRIRPWLAPLLALSVNSPYWQGMDTGFASFRHEAWGRFPSAGPTELFGDLAGYEAAVAALVGTEALLDRAMVYFDARISDRYPTVEIRVADVCLRGVDAVLVAGLSRALVHTAAVAWRDGEQPDPVRVDMLRAAQWTAAKNGLQSTLIDPRNWRPAPADVVIDALLDHVAEALTASGDLELVRELLDSIRRRGTGAVWQRSRRAGGQEWPALMRDAIAETESPLTLP